MQLVKREAMGGRGRARESAGGRGRAREGAGGRGRARERRTEVRWGREDTNWFQIRNLQKVKKESS